MKNSLSKLSSSNIDFEPSYTNQLRIQLGKKVSQYGAFCFSDDVWYCEKMQKGLGYPSEYTITFFAAGEEYKEILKYFALVSTNTIKVINDKIKNVIYFLNYMKERFPDTKLNHVNKNIMARFEHYLREDSSKGPNTKRIVYEGISSFFQALSEFPELPNEIPTKKRNPFYIPTEKKPDMYIPQSIIRQFDKVMKDETNNIPLILRVVYWLQRSFPNRINEVCSIRTDSIKALYSYHILTVPTWKQNGGYIIEEIKSIPILNSGHGKYIVDLIKKWEQERNNLIEKFPFKKEYEDILILHPPFSINLEEGKVITTCIAEDYWETIQLNKKLPDIHFKELTKLLKAKGVNLHPTSVKRHLSKELDKQYFDLAHFSSQKFNKYFKKISEMFNITDEQGKIYDISSHQFRHNATTDRLYIGGYTIDQMKILRNDKGDNMVMQYAHQQKEFHKKMWQDSTGLKGPSNSPVEFKGVIQNLTDKRVVERLKRMPSAYLTWETNGKKGVGLCSNISGCNPRGTDVHFECYECDWFVPKAEYHDDYKREYDFWKNIMESTAGNPSRAAVFENSIRNVNCLERIISICENGIEKHNREIELKLNNGVGTVGLQ